MITGYNISGEKVFEFLDLEEMSISLNLGLSNLKESFEKNRQFNFGDIIFHYDLEGDNKMVTIQVPVGSVLVTPNDEMFAELKKFFDLKPGKEEYHKEHTRPELSAEGNGFDVANDFSELHLGDSFHYNDLTKGSERENNNSLKDGQGLGGTDGGNYSENGSSEHYKKAVLEYVDKQERCYGTFMAYALCFMQVDKYRDRAGKKEGVPADKDLVKANWYDSAASFLLEKIQLHNRYEDSTEEEYESFETKFGAGRSCYINFPVQLKSLLVGELDLDLIYKVKTLGDIVNDIQQRK